MCGASAHGDPYAFPVMCRYMFSHHGKNKPASWLGTPHMLLSCVLIDGGVSPVQGATMTALNDHKLIHTVWCSKVRKQVDCLRIDPNKHHFMFVCLCAWFVQEVSSTTLDVRPTFNHARWNPHLNCVQVATAIDASVQGWDIRSMK